MKFKFEIGQETDKGVIIARYYMEWKNRHGGDMSGNYYEMENKESYAEFLLEERVSTEKSATFPIRAIPLQLNYDYVIIDTPSKKHKKRKGKRGDIKIPNH